MRFQATVARYLQPSFYVATIHALGGLREATLEWLGHAVVSGFRNDPWMVQHDRWLARHGDDPESLPCSRRYEKRGRGNGGGRVSNEKPCCAQVWLLPKSGT